MSAAQRLYDRVWVHIPIGEPDVCWPWQRGVSKGGYGTVGFHRAGHGTVTRLAHRVAWESVNGRIPEGLTIDHICRNRRCCNPSHLRLMTNVDNARNNGMAIRTHCPLGHPYDEANTYITPSTGHRICRACWASRRHARRTD